eukprot:CAMPEP_0178809414 /NCGR_PEP_ID=MMETSP0745-20121128/18096_1 /TAXON_ID=913974 /ORGANISM="Nitzschia punctata, Strain CCMP561" /LENGTH=56 /DNA_ID=CAMNT_0020469771 /DNA_START=220 /DNA_END=390 /DNA_ORIENTATION=+
MAWCDLLLMKKRNNFLRSRNVGALRKRAPIGRAEAVGSDSSRVAIPFVSDTVLGRE